MKSLSIRIPFPIVIAYASAISALADCPIQEELEQIPDHSNAQKFAADWKQNYNEKIDAGCAVVPF